MYRKRLVFIRLAVALLLIGSMLPIFHTGKAAGNGTAIVADHTVVDKYNQIPQYWINQVKKMYLNVPGESHSYGYRKGLELLMSQNSTYQIINTNDDPPAASNNQALRVNRWVYNNPRTPYTGEQEWFTWEAWSANDTNYPTANAALIKNHITYSGTHSLNITAIGLGWCYDMTDPGVSGNVDSVYYNVRWGGHSEGGPDGTYKPWGLDAGDYTLTGNRVNMDQYFQATEDYISYAQAYNTKVFFTTGPVDTESNNENGYQREKKHQYIRDYVNSNGKILFDYADILCWDNAGTQNMSSWNGHTYPQIAPDNMLDLNGGYTEDFDHIGERGALRLGKALWWLLARLAGWDGTPSSQVISITITDSSAAGIHFGSCAPGTNNATDTDSSSTTPSITVNVAPETTVNVDLQIKGTDFVASTFPVTKAKYSLTYAGAKTALSTTYATFASDKAPSSNATLWHWLDVPASGVPSGTYNSTFSYKAIAHP